MEKCLTNDNFWCTLIPNIFLQPPKKKGEKGKGKRGSKKTGSGRAQTLIDGVPITSMTKEQLEGHVIRSVRG